MILRVDPQATTLLDYHHHPHQTSGNGKPGAGDERNGADGADLVLPVPPGTVVKDATGHVSSTSSPPVRSTSSPVAAGAGWATRRSRHRAGGRPGSPCSGSRGTRSTSCSS